MVQEQLPQLSHTGTDQSHSLICHLVLSKHQSLNIAKPFDGLHIGISNSRLWQINLLSLSSYGQLFDYQLFWLSRTRIQRQLCLKLLQLLLSAKLIMYLKLLWLLLDTCVLLLDLLRILKCGYFLLFQFLILFFQVFETFL